MNNEIIIKKIIQGKKEIYRNGIKVRETSIDMIIYDSVVDGDVMQMIIPLSEFKRIYPHKAIK